MKVNSPRLGALLAALALTVTAVVPNGLRPANAQPATDSRFGVIVTGATVANPAPIQTALDALGASIWYSFVDTPGGLPGKAELVRSNTDLSTLPGRATAAPGSVWIIGNEPNVPGQDNLTPEAYSDLLAQAVPLIKGADSTAKIVGPNVLNWEVTCNGCPGYPSGREWSTAFVTDYTARYGPLPLEVWGMHVYTLDWDKLPMINSSVDQAQLAAARPWLDQQALNLPIWVTEFGVIWGYEAIEPVDGPNGTTLAKPAGSFRTDLLSTYLDEMFGFFTANSEPLRIERWYLYATVAPAEPYATGPAGISLLQQSDAGVLTPMGERFRAWANPQPATPTE